MRKMEDTESEESTGEVLSTDTVILCFTKNRSYELCIGNDRYDFTPYSSQEVPAWVLSHPDFKPVESYFTIKR